MVDGTLFRAVGVRAVESIELLCLRVADTTAKIAEEAPNSMDSVVPDDFGHDDVPYATYQDLS